MSITENVRAWLEEQGYPLEMRVAAAFRETGFEVRQSSVYIDPQSSKGREVDVIASDPDYIGCVEIHFVIECKSSKKPWILLTADDVLSSYNRLSALGVLSDATRSTFGKRVVELIDSLPWLPKSSRCGYAFRQAFSGNSDLAYTAAMNVASACEYLVYPKGDSPSAPFIIAFPLIVVDSPLLECTLQPDGKLQLDEVSQGEFLFVARLPSYFGSCIRIVTGDYLRDFAHEAKNVAERYREALMPEQERMVKQWREHKANG